MIGGSTAAALRQIGTLFGPGTVAGMTDGQLLERFLSRRDEGSEVAFTALVARHGPMVLGVCRRALPDPSDVDDAFQATFLILLRKARSVRVDDSLGRWLYGVSRKVAARARTVAARRSRHESGPLGAIEARPPDPDQFEIRATLDEELARLPESYRTAIVLCDLGGLTLEEAARDLGCPVGTIKSRLSRGRARLRARLGRRGLAPSFAMVAPSVPARLAEATIRASTFSTVGGASAVGLVPASATVLAEGMLKTMTGLKLKLAATALMTLGLAATGAGVMARQDKGDAKSSDASASDVADARVRSPEEATRSFRKLAPQDEVEKRLLDPVTLDGNHSTLERAVQSLREQTGLNIVLSPRALAEVGLTPQAPVSLHCNGVSSANALKYLLRPLGLTYQVEDDVLLITAPPSVPAHRLVELERANELARNKLRRALRSASDPKDPAIIQARQEVAEVEAATARIDDLIASVLDGKPLPEKVEKDATKPEIAKPPRQQPYRPRRVQELGRPNAVTASPPKELAKVSMPDYVVEPPDIIVVNVLEALPGRPITGERLVKPDGTISLGYYGEVYVAGLTTTEIKAKVVLHLQRFLGDEVLGLVSVDGKTGESKKTPPSETTRVSITIDSFNSKVYYVQGDVATPGRLPITGNDTVLDAINYAGGLTPTASKHNIRLVRPASPGGGAEQLLLVDYDAIVHKGDSKTNYQLFPGDRLIVYRDPASPVVPDVEARLQALERKLDEVLKAMDKLSKATIPPG